MPDWILWVWNNSERVWVKYEIRRNFSFINKTTFNFSAKSRQYFLLKTWKTFALKSSLKATSLTLENFVLIRDFGRKKTAFLPYFIIFSLPKNSAKTRRVAQFFTRLIGKSHWNFHTYRKCLKGINLHINLFVVWHSRCRKAKSRTMSVSGSEVGFSSLRDGKFWNFSPSFLCWKTLRKKPRRFLKKKEEKFVST